MDIKGYKPPPSFLKTIPGLQMWFDATDPFNTGVTPANGTNITTWYDKSGYGNNATIAGIGSNGTTYYSYNALLPPITYNTTGFNGKPALKFGGNVGGLNYGSGYFSNLNTSFSGSGMTVFMLFNTISDANSTSYGRILQLNTNRGGTGNNIGNNVIIYNGAGTYLLNTPSYNTPYLYEYWLDGYNASGIVQSGTNTTITSVTYSSSILTYGASSFGIGLNPGYIQDAGGFLNGYIAEIAVFNNSLPDSYRQIVEGYLSWKWGLQANLPTNHPYYSSAPGTTLPSPSTVLPTPLLYFPFSKDILNYASGTGVSFWNTFDQTNAVQDSSGNRSYGTGTVSIDTTNKWITTSGGSLKKTAGTSCLYGPSNYVVPTNQNGYTISFWCYLPSTTNNSAANTSIIFSLFNSLASPVATSRNNGSAKNTCWYYNNWSNSGGIPYILGNGYNIGGNYNPGVPNNAWIHVVFSLSTTGVTKFYFCPLIQTQFPLAGYLATSTMVFTGTGQTYSSVSGINDLRIFGVGYSGAAQAPYAKTTFTNPGETDNTTYYISDFYLFDAILTPEQLQYIHTNQKNS
jgi:hypothetical protein